MAGIQYLFGISIDNNKKNIFLYIFKKKGDFFIENKCITFDNMFNVSDTCTNNQIDIKCLNYKEKSDENELIEHPRIIFIQKNKNILRKYTIFYTEKENSVNINKNQICFSANPIQYQANNINSFIKKQLLAQPPTQVGINKIGTQPTIDINALLGTVTQFIDTLNKNKLNTELSKEKNEQSTDNETNESKTNESKTNESKTNESKTNESKTNESKTNESKTNEVETNEVETNEVETNEVKTNEGDSDENETDESQSSININTLLGTVAEMIHTLNKK